MAMPSLMSNCFLGSVAVQQDLAVGQHAIDVKQQQSNFRGFGLDGHGVRFRVHGSGFMVLVHGSRFARTLNSEP
jgi:hypothetical protein